MTQYFTRDGSPISSELQTDGGRKLGIWIKSPCARCGGAGRSDRWAYTGYTCYDCGGSGKGSDRFERAYTAAELERLNASLAKRRATKAAADAQKQATEQTAAETRRSEFTAQHESLLSWLGSVALDQDGHPREGFLGDMWTLATTRFQWSDAQLAALIASKTKSEASATIRAASRHVGTPGQRIDTAVTVERVSLYERPKFGADWLTECVYIVSMRDTDGNTLVSKSTSFCPEKGEQIAIRATVKNHSEYRGEMQTEVQRVKVAPRRKITTSGKRR